MAVAICLLLLMAAIVNPKCANTPGCHPKVASALTHSLSSTNFPLLRVQAVLERAAGKTGFREAEVGAGVQGRFALDGRLHEHTARQRRRGRRHPPVPLS